MKTFAILVAGWLVPAALAVAAAPGPGSPEAARDETAAERLRKALDGTLKSLEVDGQPLPLAIEQLREETRVPIVLDRQAIQMVGIDPEQAQVKLKLQNVTVRSALRSMLSPYGLAFAVVGDSLVVSTPDMAVARQLRQPVSLNLQRVQLGTALEGLARQTGVNLLLDARAQKESQAPVALKVDDVPLDAAVRLLAEMAGVKVVRLGNVLLVTSRAHALELRAEPELAPSGHPGGEGPVAIPVQVMPNPPPAPAPAPAVPPPPPAAPGR